MKRLTIDEDRRLKIALVGQTHSGAGAARLPRRVVCLLGLIDGAGLAVVAVLAEIAEAREGLDAIVGA